jgi:hypothetical protein
LPIGLAVVAVVERFAAPAIAVIAVSSGTKPVIVAVSGGLAAPAGFCRSSARTVSDFGVMSALSASGARV